MSTDLESTISNADSDYGTWSSSSSHFAELPNVSTDFDVFYNCQPNNTSSARCSSCDETTGDLNFFTHDTTLGLQQCIYQEMSKRRTSSWRGIRMGITIDYNSIKAHADRYLKRQKASFQVDNQEIETSDGGDKRAANFKQERYANIWCKNSGWERSLETSLCTITDSEENDSMDDTLGCSFPETKPSAVPSVPFNRSLKLATLVKQTPHNIRRIPQEIINNAKIVTCKVAIMGARKTGKSTLAKRQFLNEVFFGETDDEVEPILKGRNDRSNEGISTQFMIEFVDDENVEQSILRADAVVLTYSVADKKSFNEVTKLYRLIMSAKRNTIPVVLVGTKADVDNKKRRVTSFEGQSLARRFNTPFIEVSAKTNDRVHEAFVELMRLVDKQYARFRRLKMSLAPVLL